MEGEGVETGEGDIKRFKICHVRIPSTHNECNHCVLQIWTKIKIIKGGKSDLETEGGKGEKRGRGVKRIKIC